MNVTLRDVAHHAGVSIKTVSRVVNKQPDVSEETRQRVELAVAELGYHPNVLARGLARQRSQTLALVGWTLDQYTSSRFVMGVEHEAEALGYSLLLMLLHPKKSERIQTLLDNLIEQRVAGILWQPPLVGDNQDLDYT